ncbi:MAG: response regulator [Cyclobacteriaceae bacterium]|nr:response regulator [Cyclobacteriaceae bacterium]
MIKCLAIDDDRLFLRLISSFFKHIPDAHLIATFEDPIEGIMAVVKQKPDVILLDFEMPYLDGLEVINTLNRRPCKVILITNHSNLERIREISADKFINKSELINPGVLEAAILEVTQG